jgi:hypothetical protein
MKYIFSGKYGEWEEEHKNKEDAQMRAYALNVNLRKVKL